MPLQHAVLALLDDGAAHGYQLRSAFEDAVGPQWGGLNIGHLYQILERLTRDGMVSVRSVPQTSKPDRRVYELTSAGRNALDEWLDRPAERVGGFRDEFVLKLLAAARRGEQEVRSVVARQRRHELNRLKTLGELQREHRDTAMPGLLLEAATLHTKASLEFAERAERRAASLVDDVTAVRPATVEDGRSPSVRDAAS